MSTTIELKEEIKVPATSVVQRGKRGGRTRGSRGRARGRGRGMFSKMPSIEERALQVKSSSSTEVKASSPSAASIEKLSSLMDDMFPASSSPMNMYQNCILDPSGFCLLVEDTYISLVSQDHRLEDLLSYREFMLVNGWLFARRVLQIRQYIYSEELETDRFFSAIPIDTPIAGPMQLALEAIGACRTMGGTTIVPDLVLPRMDFAHDFERGMLCSLSGDSFLGVSHMEFANCMFPFGMFSRAIAIDHGVVQPHWNDRLDPANANAANDEYLAYPNQMPGLGLNGRVTSANRGRQPVGPFDRSASVLGSVMFNGTLLRSYLSFVDRAKKYMSFGVSPKTTSGGTCLSGWVYADNDDGAIPDAYSCFSSIALSKWEMHAVRLFKWRREIPGWQDCWDNYRGARIAFNSHPIEVRHAASEISDIKADSVMIRHFVKSFMLSRASSSI